MNFRATVLSLLLVVPFMLSAQMEAPENWFNLAYDSDGVYGAETEKAYKLLDGKTSKTVVVAVIDSGVDWEHEDLADVMWVNEDEIPGNGKDDDNNGYIDDVHGWNFIGGKDGNVSADNLEVTRLYRMYEKRFAGVNPVELTGQDREDYLEYLKTKKMVTRNLEKAKENLERYKSQEEAILTGIASLEKAMMGKEANAENIGAIETGDDTGMATAKNIAMRIMDGSDEEFSFDMMRDLVKEQLKGALDYFSTQAEYQYNPDFDPRNIVGDNYSDPYEVGYGNNDYEGPDAFHGTHVAGIIGAIRGNDTGMDGVADNVRIMTIRAVPDGDERDKDVANAIRYAVDNGAQVVNMSFGKSFSWNKQVVDEAVKYAKKNDVLLVHAAGNSSQDNDIKDNFPNDIYEKRGLFSPKKAKNWVEVGALNWKTGELLPASFSNYGKEQVDLFAPGVAIYSTIPDNKYRNAQGTSMASPVVAGVAALIRSYFPSLTAEQTKEILMESVTPIDETVKVPGTEEKLPFSELSVSGGIVNAAKAVELAMQTKGKKK